MQFNCYFCGEPTFDARTTEEQKRESEKMSGEPWPEGDDGYYTCDECARVLTRRRKNGLPAPLGFNFMEEKTRADALNKT